MNWVDWLKAMMEASGLTIVWSSSISMKSQQEKRSRILNLFAITVLKSELFRIRLVIDRDKLDYNDNVGSPAVSMSET